MSSVISGVGLAIYTNVWYYVTFDPKFKGIYNINPSVAAYGQWVFLTYHCLLMQMINSILHLVSTIYKPIIPMRDYFFTSLAYPASTAVVSMFWMICIAFGPDLLVPKVVKVFMPDWVNHSLHTVPLIINLSLMSLVPHKWLKNGHLVPAGYMVFYIGVLYICKFTTGKFPYPFLDDMSDGIKIVYFLVKAAYLMGLYFANRYLSQLLHGKQVSDVTNDIQDARSTSNRVSLIDQSGL